MGHNVGVTCFSIALSNFLCNKRLVSTAYIELNATNEIASLSTKSHTGQFNRVGIDFYPAVTLSGLSEILKKNYGCFVIDFGVANRYSYSELKRCNMRFAICSSSPWKKEQVKQFIIKLNENQLIEEEDILLLENNGHKTSSKPFSATIPFLENPFRLTFESFSFFEEVLERK